MKKLFKLLFLIFIILSVFFIYIKTKDSKYTILSLGDNLSLGIDSYGIKGPSYIDFYKNYILKKKETVIKNDQYSRKDLTINALLQELKENNNLKKDLSSANILILTVGYNDLIYKINLNENINSDILKKEVQEIQKDYLNLLKEIRKYYKNKIVVIGYFASNKTDYYINIGIKELNKTLQSAKNITYIDTYDLLKPKRKYFSNKNSYYPNLQGYLRISKKIIIKTLEK